MPQLAGASRPISRLLLLASRLSRGIARVASRLALRLEFGLARGGFRLLTLELLGGNSRSVSPSGGFLGPGDVAQPLGFGALGCLRGALGLPLLDGRIVRSWLRAEPV